MISMAAVDVVVPSAAPPGGQEGRRRAPPWIPALSHLPTFRAWTVRARHFYFKWVETRNNR